MTVSDEHRIAHAVQEALRKQHPSGRRTRVQADGIVTEVDGGWYYVPVVIAANEQELGFFYELFSLVEESLEKQGIDVLLAPIRRETPAGEVG